MFMIETGDILLIRHSGILSSFIRWYTKSDYAHVAISIGDEYICEIDMFEKLNIKKNPYQDFDVFRYKHNLSSSQKKKLSKYLLNKVKTNKGYDWFRILSIFLQYTFRFPVIMDEKNKVICSELIDISYKHIGIDLVPWRATGDVTPGDLARSPVLKQVA